MPGSFSVSIPNLSILAIGPSRRSESSEIEEMVRRGLQVMSSSHAVSIQLKDRSGNVAGTMTWTPTNSA